MHARVRILGLGENKGLIKTVVRNTLLNAGELANLLPQAQVQKLFPNGGGVYFDFISSKEVILHPEKDVVAHVDNMPLKTSQPQSLEIGHEKILSLHGHKFQLQVFGSHFPCQ